MAKTLELTLQVWRQDGPADAGRFETYRRAAASTTSMSFLEMLDVVNERLTDEGEEPITFDHDCREGICGTCSLMINGQAHGPQRGTATCQLHMRKFADGDTIVDRAVAGGGLPGHQGPHGRPRRVRPHRRGGWLHHRAHRWRPRRQPHPRSRRSVADAAMDAAECIGCGACVAACPNGAANLFTAAKVSHLNLLPQGQAERYRRVEAMVDTMEEYFGSCTNHGECEAACPKGISIDFIALMNKDYLKAKFKNRRTARSCARMRHCSASTMLS